MDWDCGLPFMEPCTFIDVNAQCCHPLTEGYEFMTQSFTRASVLYILIGHESAPIVIQWLSFFLVVISPRYFLAAYTFLYLLP
jgi:hypothetical protein